MNQWVWRQWLASSQLVASHTATTTTTTSLHSLQPSRVLLTSVRWGIRQQGPNYPEKQKHYFIPLALFNPLFLPHWATSWSPQSNGRDRHADKQLSVMITASAPASVPRTLEDPALNGVWGRRVRGRELEPSLQRQGAFLWKPREKNL